jgi:hypothetical protein
LGAKVSRLLDRFSDKILYRIWCVIQSLRTWLGRVRAARSMVKRRLELPGARS